MLNRSVSLVSLNTSATANIGYQVSIKLTFSSSYWPHRRTKIPFSTPSLALLPHNRPLAKLPQSPLARSPSATVLAFPTNRFRSSARWNCSDPESYRLNLVSLGIIFTPPRHKAHAHHRLVTFLSTFQLNFSLFFFDTWEIRACHMMH